MPTICQCLVTSSPPTPSCDSNCIYTPDMLYDEVTACGGSTILSIAPVTANCDDITPSYSIHSYENVTNVSITPTTITFTPANNDYAPGKIKYKVRCGMLSSMGTILINYLDMCISDCPLGQYCDKCTGDCENAESDLSDNTVVTPTDNPSGLLT